MESSDTIRAGTGSTIVLISPNPEVTAELVLLANHHLAGSRMLPVKDYPEPEQLKELLAENPRLCFLDVTSDPERAVKLIGDLQIIEPGLPIIILLAENTPDLILRCLRQGATEFLIRPFTPEDLKPVLVRLSQLSPTLTYGKGAKIICVAPTKGACGASTIASNLAYQRKRMRSEKMLLVDFDPLTGTIAFLLKLKSNYSFVDAMNRASSLDEDLWKGMVCHVEGLDVLLAPENPMDTMREVRDPTPVLEFARQLYDTIIVDSAGALTEWGLALAAACDELLLVTTNELPALQATQKVLAHLDRHRVERSKVRLIVNRYSREVGLGKAAIATALYTDVYHIIPSDYESVQRALVEGKPIPATSAFGKSLIELAEKLSGKKTTTSEEKKHSKSSSWGGIFSSLFSRATS